MKKIKIKILSVGRKRPTISSVGKNFITSVGPFPFLESDHMSVGGDFSLKTDPTHRCTPLDNTNLCYIFYTIIEKMNVQDTNFDLEKPFSSYMHYEQKRNHHTPMNMNSIISTFYSILFLAKSICSPLA